MIWFTSDQHFDHKNIIKFCTRPFISADHMTEGMVSNHNELVGPKDDVYHLGDFTFRLEAEQYLKRLNGQHHLILGNHDHKVYHSRKRPGVWKSINDSKLIRWNGHKFYLNHYSCRVWPSSHRGSFHLYGHSHGTLAGFGRSMDVGVDTNGMCPYSGDEVVEILSKEDFIGVDHHRKAFGDCVEPTND